MSIDQRDAVQVLEDALCKHRVLRGIALLEAEHGPDWADKVDLDDLDLSSAHSCVLGQLYRGATVPDSSIEKYMASARGQDQFRDALTADAYFNGRSAGYERGIAILDGPLLDTNGAAWHGFEDDTFHLTTLDPLTDQELADEHGITRDQLEAAAALMQTREPWIRVAYDDLQAWWESEITERA